MARPRNLDLSRQQRRVLELMARGRTNYDIAQELGVSLEGAKYHIRQVFDKLGVDSREEAVAAWQASRGGLFERVRGWLWPVGALAAGGAAVIAAVVAGAVMLTGGSSAAAGEVWVAAISDSGTLSAFDATNAAADRHVFAGRYPIAGEGYARVKWSPDGRHLTVSGSYDGSNRQLVTFTRSSSGWSDTPMRSAEGSWFAWSPDSTMLAAFGAQSTLTDGSGKVITRFDAPLDPSDDVLSIGPISWAADSRAFAGSINNLLVVVGADGGHAYTPPGADWTFYLTGWSDSQTVLAMVSKKPDQNTAHPYAIHLDGAAAKWTALPNSSVPTTLPTPNDEVLASWTGSQNDLAAIGTTTDGRGIIYGPALGYPFDPNGGLDYHLIVTPRTGQPVLIDFGETSIRSIAAPAPGYDIVVVR